MPPMHTQMWHNMFALGLPIAEKILRPKKPAPDVTRHEDIMKRLDQMTAQLAALKA